MKNHFLTFKQHCHEKENSFMSKSSVWDYSGIGDAGSVAMYAGSASKQCFRIVGPIG